MEGSTDIEPVNQYELDDPECVQPSEGQPIFVQVEVLKPKDVFVSGNYKFVTLIVCN